jgi:anti-sigma B factor antagonist
MAVRNAGAEPDKRTGSSSAVQLELASDLAAARRQVSALRRDNALLRSQLSRRDGDPAARPPTRIGLDGSRSATTDPPARLAEPFDVSAVGDAAGARVLVAGELDIATVPALRARLEADGVPGAEHLVLDLTAVTFIDSTGVRALLELSERRPSLQIAASDACLRVLAAAGLAGTLPVIPAGR